MTKRFKASASARYVGEVALAVSLAALTGTAFAAAPGYVTSSDNHAVTDSSGNCWKTSGWTAQDARSPCDAVPTAATPAPATIAEAPQPAPVAEAAPPRVIQKIELSTDVLFPFDSANLLPAGKKKLDEIAQSAQGADVDRVVILGYADRIGKEQYNQDLSDRRAQAVRDYLAQQGTEPDRVQAEGRGESDPVTGNECDNMGPARKSNSKLVACLQPDRRVEIQMLGSRETASTGTPSSAGATAPASPGSSSNSSSGR